MINLEYLAKPFQFEDYEIFKNNASEILTDIVFMYFEDKPMFQAENLNFFFYDEYTINTLVKPNTYFNFYVEINQPRNYKLNNINKKNKLIPDTHLTLKEIKKGLFDLCVNNFGSETLIWQEKYSVNLKITTYEENTEVVYYIKIIPCFTHFNSNGKSGIIYYDNDKKFIEIEYPDLSILNYNKKNKETKGLFEKYVVLFKNLYLDNHKKAYIPFELFEIMLYNVPNQLFVSLSTNNLVQILNYIRNKNIKEYLSLDEQDNAYVSKYKSYSVIYIKYLISQIEKLVKSLR